MTKFSSITFIWSGFEVEQILLENKYFSKDNQKVQKYICIFALFAFFFYKGHYKASRDKKSSPLFFYTVNIIDPGSSLFAGGDTSLSFFLRTRAETTQ